MYRNFLGKISKPLELFIIYYYDICSINKLSHRATNWKKNDAKMTNLHPLYRSLWFLHANLIRLTANFHLIVWTNSSWTRWASFPRDLIFFGRSFWYLKKIITGYSFWDWWCNFLHKFTWIVLSVHKLNKLGKFW